MTVILKVGLIQCKLISTLISCILILFSHLSTDVQTIQQQNIAKLSRSDLEDLYYQLHDDHTEIKKKFNNLDSKYKMLVFSELSSLFFTPKLLIRHVSFGLQNGY